MVRSADHLSGDPSAFIIPYEGDAVYEFTVNFWNSPRRKVTEPFTMPTRHTPLPRSATRFQRKIFRISLDNAVLRMYNKG